MSHKSDTGLAVGYRRGRAEIPSPGALRWARGTAHPRLPSSRPLAQPWGSTTSPPNAPRGSRRASSTPKLTYLTRFPEKSSVTAARPPWGSPAPQPPPQSHRPGDPSALGAVGPMGAAVGCDRPHELWGDPTALGGPGSPLTGTPSDWDPLRLGLGPPQTMTGTGTPQIRSPHPRQEPTSPLLTQDPLKLGLGPPQPRMPQP